MTGRGGADVSGVVESNSTFRERNDDGLLVVSLRQHQGLSVSLTIWYSNAGGKVWGLPLWMGERPE